MLEKFKKIDLSIVIILLVFMVISTLLVHSATVDDPRINPSIMKIVLIYIVGIIAFIGSTFVDYRLLLKGAPFLYIFGILLLVGLHFFGTEINYAKSWYKLPMDTLFQPAELVKLLLVITLAAFIARRQGEPLEVVKDVLPVGMIVLLPFILVLSEPDLGNGIIFLVVLLGILWVGNIKFTHILIGASIIAACIFIIGYFYTAYHDPLLTYLKGYGIDHWMVRIDTFINPLNATSDESYQVNHSMTAIGRGALFGEGYLNGSSIHRNMIPYAYSDSIFVVVGEEFGFLGASVLLLLYFLLIYRMILISLQAVHIGGSMIVIGIVSMFVFQVFENIGMLIGLMPLTGITLPFISYGGTSLLINMLSIGIVMSIKVHQEKSDLF